MALRLVFVGDDGAGKTSLVSCIVNDSFQEKTPVPVLPEVAAPADLQVSPSRGIILVDTSNKPTARLSLQQEMRAADVILIVYDVNNTAALSRVSIWWLPMIKKLTNGVIPVVLVGNKIDGRLEATGSLMNPNLEKELRPFLNVHKEVEAVVECVPAISKRKCSAKDLKNVRDVVYFAQKSVLFPLRTLYDSMAGQLRPQCVVALKRIFVLSDQDRDNALSDKEFADFQIRCYGDRVQGKFLVDAKEIVRNELPTGLNDKGLTLDGFLFLHHRLVKMGHHERVWSVLQRFGYNKDLEFSAEAKKFNVDTRKKMYVLLYLLSVEGIRWLENLFLCYASPDGRMTRAALESLLLAAIPPELPKAWRDFPRSIPTSPPDNALSMDSFLLLWRLLIAENPIQAVTLAFQLGFDGKIGGGGTLNPSAENAPHRLLDVLTRDPWTRRRGLDYMTNVLVLGPAMGGKSTLISYLWNMPFTEKYDPESAHDRHVMGCFQAYPGRTAVKYYLCLHEVHSDDMVQPLTKFTQQGNYDVIVMVYDANDVEAVQEVWRALKRGLKMLLREATSDAPLPVLLFANKADAHHPNDPDLQQAERELCDLCDEYLIPHPRPVSLKNLDAKDQLNLWRLFAGGPRELRESNTRTLLRRVNNYLPRWAWWGLATALAIGSAYALLQFFSISRIPMFRVTSGVQISTEIGDREFYDVYAAHDVEPDIHNLLPEEQERFADVVHAGALQNRRPIEPIHWQFPHSPGYQRPIEPPVSGPMPYQKYNQPGRYDA